MHLHYQREQHVAYGKDSNDINTGEARETSYLFQRISVLVQRFNAVLLHDSLPAADSTD